MPKIILLWNQSNTFGLSQDASLIENAMEGLGYEIVRLDPLQPPSPADIVVHLEVPHPVWLPWAPTQILMVNPEWFSPSWTPYLSRFTQVWVKEQGRVSDLDQGLYICHGLCGGLLNQYKKKV
jgi:hypothetical protein